MGTDILTEEKTVDLFEKFGVFTRAELESRAEIQYETYAKAINIESRSMIDIASKHIIPSVLQYTTALATSINQIREACGEANISVQIELLKECSSLLAATKAALRKLTEVTDASQEKKEGRIRAVYFQNVVVPAMEDLRQPVDKLEMLVAKDMWPMPSYGDLLFEV